MLAILLILACPSEADRLEGSVAGDCSDAADNDVDGRFDCDDDGCAGSSDCATDTDTDTDADTDADADADTDTDTDADTDTDTDVEPGPAARWSGETRMPAGYRLKGAHVGDGAGTGMAAGDFDADGQDDVLVGAYSASEAAEYAGVVYLLHGPITADQDLSTAAVATIAGTVARGFAGGALATLPDLDGDGGVEFVVGAAGIGDVAGSVCLFSGATTGPTELDAGTCWTGEAIGDQAGHDVSAAADLTGDGAPDLLVGAPMNDFFVANGGSAYVVDPTSSGGSLAGADVHVYGDRGWLVGGAVIDVGDLDADGVTDLAVGASGYGTDTVPRMGAVLVFHGPLAGNLASSDADASLVGHAGESYLGYEADSVAERVDVDGDGRHDLVAGAEGPMANGQVWVVSGSNLVGAVDTLFADATITGEGYQDSFGMRLTSAADADADGVDDFLIGAPGADPHGESSGIVYLAYGPVSGTVDAEDLVQFTGDTTSTYLGTGLGSGVFDLTGDGVQDLLLAGSSATGAVALSGCAYVLPGVAP